MDGSNVHGIEDRQHFFHNPFGFCISGFIEHIQKADQFSYQLKGSGDVFLDVV